MSTVVQPVVVSSNATAVFTCILAALAGLMFGLDIGVISGAQKFIQQEFQVSDSMIEWIVSIMMAGAAVGALSAAWMSATLGRKRSLILGAVLFVAGSVLCGVAWGPQVLIVGRLILGVAIGIASFTAPLYLAEIAPERIRGAMISLYQLMITSGILVAFLSDTAFSYTGNWRWMLGHHRDSRCAVPDRRVFPAVQPALADDARPPCRGRAGAAEAARRRVRDRQGDQRYRGTAEGAAARYPHVLPERQLPPLGRAGRRCCR